MEKSGPNDDLSRRTNAPFPWHPGIMDAVPMGVCVTDREGLFVEVNAEYCRIHGYFREELIGKHFTLVVPEGSREQASGMHDAFFPEGIEPPGERTMVDKHGKEHIVHVTARPLDLPDGSRFRVATVQDVSERKTLEAENQRMQGLLSQAELISHIGSWEVDMLTGKNRWSDELFRIYGMEPGSVEPTSELGLMVIHPDDRANAIKALQQALDGGEPYVSDNRVLRADGSIRHVRARSHVERGADGHPLKLLGMLQDVTDLVEKERELAERNAMLESAEALGRMGRWEYVPATGSFIWSDEHARICGYEPGTVTPDLRFLLDRLVVPEDRSRVQQMMDDLRRGIPYDGVLRYRTADGSTIHVQVKARTAQDLPGENGARVLGVIHDITDEVLREQELLRVKAEQEALMNGTDDLIWSVGRDYRLIAANRACTEAIRTTSGRAVRPGDHISAMVMGKGIANEWLGHYQRALAGERFSIMEQWSVSGKDQRTFHDISFSPIARHGEVYGVACYAKDVTEQEQGLEHLERSQAELSRAQEIAKLGSWQLDGSTGRLTWSDMVYSIWERPKDFQPDLESFFATVHPDDRPELEAKKDLLIEGKSPQEQVHRIVLPDGRIKWVYERAETALAPDGRPVVNGIVQDITQVHELEDLLARATHMARIGSWELDLLKQDLYWSPMTREIHEVEAGYTPDPDASIRFYKDDGDRERIRAAMDRAVSDGTPWDEELVIITAKGNERWVRTMGQAEMAGERCTRLLGSLQDIHAQKAAEQDRTRVLRERDSFLERINDAFIGLSSDWTVTYWNKEAEHVLGKSKEDTLNKYIWDLYPDAKEFKAEYEKAMTTQEARHFEAHYATAGKWFEVNAYPSPEGLSIFFRDITGKRMAQQEIERLGQVLDRSLNEIYMFDPGDLRFTYLNKGALLNIGYTMEEMGSMTPMDIKPHYTPERFKELIAPLIGGEQEIVGFETFHRRKDGSEYPVHVHLGLDRSGERPVFIAIILDITHRLKTEEDILRSNERFHLVSQATQDAIWDRDIINGTLHWGDGFHTLFGHGREQSFMDVGSWEQYIHPDDRENVERSLNEVLENPSEQRWTCEYRYRRADGGHSFVADHGIVMRDANGRAVRMVGAMRDLSTYRAHEETLERLNEELTASNKELAQFAYVASHDLQEPLRMVTGFLSKLEERSSGRLDKKAMEYLSFAAQGAEHMRNVIQDLLRYSRAGRGSYEAEEVDLNEMMTEVTRTYATIINETGAHVTWEELPTVRGARTPLQQVLQNLVGNALKYREEGSAPMIKVSASADREWWHIRVQDNGIGIAPEHHDRIFEVFQRLHASDKFSGTGIGLAICRKIVEAHGGIIQVGSEPGKGSTFHFTLPR